MKFACCFTFFGAILFLAPALAQEAPDQPPPEAPPPPDAAEGESGDEKAGKEDLVLPPAAEAPGEASSAEMKEAGSDGGLSLDSDNLDVPDGWNEKPGEPRQEAPSETWEDRGLQIFEIHGYFRTRGQLYHKIYMRNDNAVFLRPMEKDYATDCRDSAWGDVSACDNSTFTGANLRLRLEPQLNVSEEVRVKAQFDLLDNLVLGSTPADIDNGQEHVADGTVSPSRFSQSRQETPTWEKAFAIKRAWGEVMTPLGEIRFGRMGDQWGTGMMHNAGADIYQDYGDSIDRVLFSTKIAGIILTPAFDFINEGATSTFGPRPWNTYDQAIDIAQLDDAYQLVGIVAYQRDADEQEAMLRRGDVVVNTGVYFQYRSQVLSLEPQDSDDDGLIDTLNYDNETEDVYAFVRRDYWGVIPDVWFQLLYEHLHAELELVFIYGDVKNVRADTPPAEGITDSEIVSYGGVVQVDYGLLNDQLRLGLEVGFASGDPDVEGMRTPTDMSQINNPSDDTYAVHSFNPAYNVDLILFREVLGSITGAYYFNPWVRYDFLYSRAGKQLGAQLDVLYSRASTPDSTIGNDANLGVEINVGLFYRSEDMFYAGLQYGVLFPLGAFEGEVETLIRDPNGQNPPQVALSDDTDLTTPQTVQGLLGISF